MTRTPGQRTQRGVDSCSGPSITSLLTIASRRAESPPRGESSIYICDVSSDVQKAKAQDETATYGKSIWTDRRSLRASERNRRTNTDGPVVPARHSRVGAAIFLIPLRHESEVESLPPRRVRDRGQTVEAIRVLHPRLRRPPGVISQMPLGAPDHCVP